MKQYTKMVYYCIHRGKAQRRLIAFYNVKATMKIQDGEEQAPLKQQHCTPHTDGLSLPSVY